MNSLEKGLGTLKPGQSLIIVTTDEKYFTVASMVLEYMTKKKKHSGVYVSISKPFEKVVNAVKNVDWGKVLFLDGVSRSLRKKAPEGEGCVFLQGPTSLTEIGIYLTKASQKTELGFVIVDSVSSLLVYNKDATVLRFVQYLVAKTKNLELVGIVVVSKDDEEKAVFKMLNDMSDKVIRY